MLVDLVNQWQSALPVARPGLLRGPGRLGAWGVALWLGMGAACMPRKDNECATVQARVLEEIRVADGFHDHFHDAAAITQHAHRLRHVSSKLRALDVRDATLRHALERYLASLDRLADAYARVADSQARGLVDGGGDAGDPVDEWVSLGVVLSTHAAAVNGARSAISNACNVP